MKMLFTSTQCAITYAIVASSMDYWARGYSRIDLHLTYY